MIKLNGDSIIANNKQRRASMFRITRNDDYWALHVLKWDTDEREFLVKYFYRFRFSPDKLKTLFCPCSWFSK